MEGPAETGEGCEALTPTCTTAARNSMVSGETVNFCVSVAVFMCNETSGWSPKGLECVTSSQHFSDLMDASTDVRALSWPKQATGEVNIT